uniref:Uncharacterized protein n=1 Tax=Oncorhynchus tshawytscha TaxID=74940 RepID=A0A8C8C1B9_ONCTS
MYSIIHHCSVYLLYCEEYIRGCFNQFTRNTFQKLFDVVLNNNSHLVALSPFCQLNDSLSQLYTDFRSFKLHLDWLIDVRVSMSLPVSLTTVEVTRVLQHISSLCSTALQQIACPLPQISIPSFPTQLTTWDVVLLSYEIPERLGFYCQWSTRVLVLLKSRVQGL